MRILREPLFHFAVLGLGIFAWFAWLNPADPTAATGDSIVFDAADVERLSEQFEATWRRPPNPAELDSLIAASLREEVLVREARALGLDQGDGVIRNRLVQKMDFLTTSVAQAVQPEDATLIEHLEANAERFRTPPLVAFDQVFLGETPSEDEVGNALAVLRADGDPADVGQPSLLPASLPLTGARTVDGGFGQGVFDALMTAEMDVWSGPVRSGYGLHLVRVTEREQGALPPFDEVRDAVVADWRREMSDELSAAQYEGLKARYQIILPENAVVAEGTGQ